MGANSSKLRCLYLPAQSGKTRKAEEEIRRFKAAEKISDEESIDIWISANNKLLVYQTTSRLKKDLGTSSDSDSDSENTESNATITGDIFSWTSGTKATNISADTLAWNVAGGKVGMIIVCSHKQRLRYVATLLERLHSAASTFNKKINIWIDEADYSINLWSKHENIVNMPLITNITLVSATFGSVFSKYNELKVIPFLDTAPVVYRRLAHCKKIEEGTGKEDAGTYVDAVLTKYPHLTTAGLRAFIPGNIGKGSHEDISERLIGRGFVVLILNGEHKEIRFPNGEPTIDLKEYLTVSDPTKMPEEFNLNLARLYKKHNIARFPMAITGFLCVERGITFQIDSSEEHDGFLFDYAIVSPIGDKAEAYQAMARVFGNVAGFKGYKPCIIYSDPKTFNGVTEQEEAAVWTAHIVHEEKLELVDKTVLKRASYWEKEIQWNLSMNEFDTFEEAKAYVKNHGGHSPKTPVENEDGFYESSTTKKKAVLNYKDVIAEMRGWSKTAVLDPHKNPERTFHSRLFICYKDVEDIDSVVFLVRSIQKKVIGLRRKRLV
jgi:hypothetical protein